MENGRILENLRKLSDLNRPVWIRVPVIPDVNDTIQEITAIAGFLKTLNNVKDITLMPYHTLGKSKYETLGLVCGYHTDKMVAQKKLKEFEAIMREVLASAFALQNGDGV